MDPAATATGTSIYKNDWERIGFHRQIAGFFYNYIPVLLGGVFLTMGAGIIIPLFLPYPDAQGYSEVARSMYALMFLLFDAGVGSAIGRFVPHYRVKDPKRSLQYLSFFIWFQMFTGLAQITAIAIYIFNWMPGNVAHLAWIFIVYSTVQYPGMLGVIGNGLKSFQHYSKYIFMKFMQDIFQFFTQLGFILIGRFLGAMNPAFGEMVGMSIGLVIGLYLDDFLAFLLGVRLFNNVLRDLGLDVQQHCLRPNFTMKIAKESLFYGLKTMPSGLYGTMLGFFAFIITLNVLPQYAAWLGLMNIVKTFTGQIGMAGNITSNTEYAISEAYNNGKINLSQFYVAMALKWRFILTMFIGLTIVIVLPYGLGYLLNIFGENWLPALTLFFFLALPQFINMFTKPVSFTMLNHPGYDQAIGIASSTASFLWYVILVYGLGTEINIYIYLVKDIPITITFFIIQWIVLQKKIFKIRWRDFTMQAYVLAIPGIVLYALFCWAFGELVMPLGVKAIGEIPFVVISIVAALFFFPPFIFCPLISIFGAWDKYNMEAYQLAIGLSGPSKFMTKLMFKTSFFFYQLSPLKDKFPIKNVEIAMKEARELQEEKTLQDMVNIKEKTGL